ncbi:hypothetical protein WDV93_11230 [Pantoea ananatis]
MDHLLHINVKLARGVDRQPLGIDLSDEQLNTARQKTSMACGAMTA